MIYQFTCDECGLLHTVDARAFRPPRGPKCCDAKTRRIFGCHIDTSMCKDHDDIPEQSRVSRGLGDVSRAAATREEQRFQRHITERRKNLADGGNRGSFRHTNSVPADLFHGKIRETGDKEYWNDPRNVRKHKNTKVD